MDVAVGKKRAQHESEPDFRDVITSGGALLGLNLEQTAVARLAVYYEELRHWSRKINLIAKGTTAFQIIENHFLDSLTLLSRFQPGDSVHLLDVGTGAGFPGLVCKAARPDIAVTLVEPRLKRVSFLQHIVRTLQLDGVEVLANRVEERPGASPAGPFTHVTGRAVADIAGFLAMVKGVIQPETEIICMKGPGWRQELEAAQEQIAALGLEVDGTHRFTLPFSGAKRVLVGFKILAKSS